MKSILPALAATAFFAVLLSPTQAQQAPVPQDGVITADYTNPGLSPSHWVLTLRRDGTGHFHADRGNPGPARMTEIEVPDEDRDIRLSKDFTAKVFATAQDHNWFNMNCESHS